MKLAGGLRAALSNHPFPPDEEGGIYAVLDESANIMPITADQCALVLDGEGYAPSIALDFIGPWIVNTSFQEALFADEQPDSDWFETTIVHEDADLDSVNEVQEAAHAIFYAPSVEAALCNHKRAVQMAQTL
jgi:hypothetical protein